MAINSKHLEVNVQNFENKRSIKLLYIFFWVIPRRLTSGNYPEENMQPTEHGENLKSRRASNCLQNSTVSNETRFINFKAVTNRFNISSEI
jgi:hypothetical protein